MAPSRFDRWKKRFTRRKAQGGAGSSSAKGADASQQSAKKLLPKGYSVIKSYRRSQGIGQMLLKKGLINRKQLDAAFQIQKERRKVSPGQVISDLYLSSILVDEGYVEEQQLANLFSVQWQMPVVKLSESKIKKELLRIVPSDLARRFCVFPLDRVGKVIILAVFDPTIEDIMTYLAKQIGYNVKPAIAVRSEIVQFLDAHYPEKKSAKGKRAGGRKKPAPPRRKPAAKGHKKTSIVKPLRMKKGQFTNLRDISLEQQADTWVAGKVAPEQDAIRVHPAFVALFTSGPEDASD